MIGGDSLYFNGLWFQDSKEFIASEEFSEMFGEEMENIFDMLFLFKNF